FISSNGMSLVSAPVNVTLGPGNNKLTLSNIPVGPAGTTSRRIFRKSQGDAGPYKFVGPVKENAPGSFTDTISDANRGPILRDADAQSGGGVTTRTSGGAENTPGGGGGWAISSGPYRKKTMLGEADGNEPRDWDPITVPRSGTDNTTPLSPPPAVPAAYTAM